MSTGEIVRQAHVQRPWKPLMTSTDILFIYSESCHDWWIMWLIFQVSRTDRQGLGLPWIASCCALTKQQRHKAESAPELKVLTRPSWTMPFLTGSTPNESQRTCDNITPRMDDCGSPKAAIWQTITDPFTCKCNDDRQHSLTFSPMSNLLAFK